MYLRNANKTAIQSQRMIADALFSLMENKAFQNITVKEICQKAGVGRKTFYRNFELREDVIDFWLDRMCAQYQQEILGMGAEEQLRHHFLFVKEHAGLFILLYHNGFHQKANEKFAVILSETMPTWSEDPVEQSYQSEFIISGMEAIERVWISRNFAENIEQIVGIVHRAQSKQLLLKEK